MTPKDPFLEGTFWEKFWRPLRSRVLLFTPERARLKVVSAFERLIGSPWLGTKDFCQIGNDMFLRSFIKGRRPTQKTTHPNNNSLHKQFTQTILLVFCVVLREKGGSLYKLSRSCLRKLCFYLGGWFLGGGSPLHEFNMLRNFPDFL